MYQSELKTVHGEPRKMGRLASERVDCATKPLQDLRDCQLRCSQCLFPTDASHMFSPTCGASKLRWVFVDLGVVGGRNWRNLVGGFHRPHETEIGSSSSLPTCAAWRFQNSTKSGGGREQPPHDPVRAIHQNPPLWQEFLSQPCLASVCLVIPSKG